MRTACPDHARGSRQRSLSALAAGPQSTRCGRQGFAYSKLMESLDQRLMDALALAADELGFRLVSPFDLLLANDQTVRIEGYLPDFGGPNGIALVSFQRRIKLDAVQFPTSILTKEYRKYSRKLFVSALSDWGWSGSGAGPDWLAA